MDSRPAVEGHRDARHAWLLLAGAALATCVGALFNRFPLTYPDSSNYLDNAIDLTHWHRPWFFFRPLAYDVFLTPFATGLTIWLLPLVQGLLVAIAVRLALRTAGVDLPGGTFLALLGGLSVLTGLSWFSGQIMPDVFTSIMILLTFVVLWAPDDARWRGLIVPAGLLSLAIATHISHFLIYPVMWSVGVVARAASARPARAWPEAGRAAVRGGLPLLLALGAVIGPNYIRFRQPVLSRSAPLFTLARLMGAGAAQPYLERVCPEKSYALCAELGHLPVTMDDFLWDPAGPAQRAFAAMERGDSTLLQQAPEIVAGTIRQEWRAVLRSGLRDAALQLVSFGQYGEGFSRHVGATLERLGPATVRAYQGSRQVSQTLPAAALTRVHYVVVCAGFAVLLVLLPRWRRPQDGPFCALVALVLLGILVNADVLGSLSQVHPRYAARVIWLVPLLGAVAVLRWRDARREPSVLFSDQV